ncbi:MAG: hypothetical protein AAGF48_01780 [Pseudomonadota bacterium]
MTFRSLGLALLASAGLANAANAQAVNETYGPLENAVEVPRPYAIPLPPNANARPQWEVGTRYWWSEGSTRFDIDSARLAPDFYGSPTSTLTYDGVTGNALEFFMSTRNESGTFFKGFVGGGWLGGGSLDDEDFFTGQVKFSDTYSEIDGEGSVYFTLDLGQDIDVGYSGNLIVSPFVGFNFWQESMNAYGARCNRDDVDGLYCGDPGTLVLPFTSEVINNKSMWSSVRLGTEVTAYLFDRVSFRGDAAILPVAYLVNEDSHHYRRDLGRTPNIEHEGTGWGYQLEGEVKVDVTDNWTLGAGVRYWYAETGGVVDFVNTGSPEVDLEDFETERLGVFGSVSYRFSTF